MAAWKTSGVLIALLMSVPVLTPSARAVSLVTYSWTTTSEGFGPHVDQPSSATFQVPLSNVQAGVVHQSDISNIQLAYPGLAFDSGAASSVGFDFSAFVNPTTGAFEYHDTGQGLAVIAFAGFDINSATTLLSITVGNPNAGFNGVADQFNALDAGQPYAGYPTAGYWTASFPTVTAAPLPSALPLFAAGIGGLGFLGWRRKNASGISGRQFSQSRRAD